MADADAPLASTRPRSPGALVALLVGAVVATGVLYGVARARGWTLGWIHLGVLGGAFLVNLGCLLAWNPTLIRQRIGIRGGTKRWDLVWTGFFLVLTVATIAAAVWEVRAAGPATPGPVWLLGMALFVPAWILVIASMVENPFFEKGVRIQTERGHRVIDTGPYAIVRHPGYLGFALWLLSTPPLLALRWSWVPVLATLAALVIRTVLEDRTLQAELPGYDAYATRTRHRLVPGVW